MFKILEIMRIANKGRFRAFAYH